MQDVFHVFSYKCQKLAKFRNIGHTVCNGFIINASHYPKCFYRHVVPLICDLNTKFCFFHIRKPIITTQRISANICNVLCPDNLTGITGLSFRCVKTNHALWFAVMILPANANLSNFTYISISITDMAYYIIALTKGD